MKKFLSVLLAVAMVLAFAACGQQGTTQPAQTSNQPAQTSGSEAPTGGSDAAESAGVIKIGVFEAMTGGNASAGELEYEGMSLGNYARPTVTIDGKTYDVELVVSDNKTDTVEAVTAAARLVSEGCVAALGGTGSGLCIAAGPTFLEAKMPIIGTTCTNPLVTLDNPYYFRMCYTDASQGSILANYAKQTWGASNAAVITDVTDTYCIGLATYFKEAMGEENIVSEVYFNTGDQDFSGALATTAAANPDCVFSGSQYTEGALMQVQAKSAGYDFKFLGTDGWDTNVLLEIGGDALDGCVFVTFFDYELNADNPKVQEVLALYQEVTGAAPRSSYGAMCLDAYNVLCDAIEACNSTDGETLRDAIAATDKEYATGYYKFDENGDADVDTCYLRSCKGGEFVTGGSVKMH